MRSVRRQFRTLGAKALSLPQLRLLARLRRSSSTNAALADHLGVSLPAVTRLVQGLMKKGHVTRTVVASDRRQAQLECTAKGRESFMRVRGRVQTRLATGCERLSAADQAALLRGLEALGRLADVLEAQDQVDGLLRPNSNEFIESK